jgi:glutathione S-transferase
MVRTPEAQQGTDAQCQSLVLYHYKTCPFCMKVRQEMRRLSLNIRHIDAQPEGSDRAALVAGGGLAKVPCLKITDAAGASQWLYDSDQIISYLRGRFMHAP